MAPVKESERRAPNWPTGRGLTRIASRTLTRFRSPVRGPRALPLWRSLNHVDCADRDYLVLYCRPRAWPTVGTVTLPALLRPVLSPLLGLDQGLGDAAVVDVIADCSAGAGRQAGYANKGAVAAGAGAGYDRPFVGLLGFDQGLASSMPTHCRARFQRLERDAGHAIENVGGRAAGAGHDRPSDAVEGLDQSPIAFIADGGARLGREAAHAAKEVVARPAVGAGHTRPVAAVPGLDQSLARATAIAVPTHGRAEVRRDAGHAIEVVIVRHGVGARHDRPVGAVPGLDQGLRAAVFVGQVDAHAGAEAGRGASHAKEVVGYSGAGAGHG